MDDEDREVGEASGDEDGEPRHTSGKEGAGEDARRASYELDPLVIEVDPESGEVMSYDPRSLLDEGNEALQEGAPERAMVYYEQIREEFPDSRLLAPALYNRGLALERLGKHDRAIAQYRELAERVETGRDAIDATLRAGAVMAELGRFPPAIDVFEALLERDDLTRSDRVEGHARLGYVLYENKSDPRAEEVLRKGIDIATTPAEGERLETNYFVAMSYFYLGMIPRRRFREIPLRLPDDQMERDIEAKSELVLLSHDRLTEAIDAGHPYWATAAGYELGAMQEEFWRAIVSAPIPPHLEPRAARRYTEEVHRHAREFLERALNLYKKTVELGDAYRTSTQWSRAAEARAESVAELIARERAGDRVEPESEAPSSSAGEPDAPDWDVARYIPSRSDL